MERKIDAYKRKFDRELRHIKLILMNNKTLMPSVKWLQLVYQTKTTITENPQDFFPDIPEQKILIAAMDKVFQGFLADQKIRDGQKKNLRH